MKMTRKLILGVSAAMSSLAVAGVGATAFKNANIKTPLNAASPTTMRRIWVYDSDLAWWNNRTEAGVVYAGFDIHAWGGEGVAPFDVSPIRTHDDYYGGLYYADIPSNCTQLLFHKTGVWGGGNQTSDLKVPAFGQPDVFNVTKGLNGNSNRNCVVGTAPMGQGQVEWLLSYYDTCSDSQANGYMAYPQLMTDFISSSKLEMNKPISNAGPVDKGFNGKFPTIQQKLDAMKAKYLAHK